MGALSTRRASTARPAKAEAECGGAVQHRLSAGFVECHREGIFDLLSTDVRPRLHVREADDGRTFVKGSTSVAIHSVPQLLQLVADGSARRRTAETGIFQPIYKHELRA